MLSYLIKKSRYLLAAATTASVISGSCSVLMLAQINSALTSNAAARESLAWTFGAIAVIAALSHMASSVLFERLSQSAHAELRHFISSRVIATGYRKLEEIGGPKVLSALSEHSAKVADFFVCFPAVLVNGIVVTGCLLYMALLSWQVFMIALVVVGFGTLGYYLAQLRAIKFLDKASHEQDRLFSHFRSLIDGAKELRLNSQKREIFEKDVLGGSIDEVRQQRTTGMSIFALSASWGGFLIYMFIGLVLFVLVGDVPNRTQIMTGFSLVFLYMMTPLECLLLNIPRANLARISSDRIEEITREMVNEETKVAHNTASVAALQSLTLKNVSHRYYHEASGEIFQLGPISLRFTPGEINFLVGGNGSGKTTLAKLLVGLYLPEEGEIILNGKSVTHANRDHYRQNFSAIFSDFHLFDRLLEVATPDLDTKGNQLLQKLYLQHKVQVREGAFTTQSLSQGQRKRLALVISYLENRPFLVFDEWAADQDPVFKDVFYREVLPELRDMGKIVFVISHDDRYFDLADRLIRMENGQIISIENKLHSIDKRVEFSKPNHSIMTPINHGLALT